MAWLLILVILSGCASMGIRPDEPTVDYTAAGQQTNCKRFTDYLAYSRELREAYHARATSNRTAIYVGGTLGLATIAASGGLAAAAVSTLTIALLSISGGFASGFFALLGNDRLARNYTAAANKVDEAIRGAEEKAKMGDEAACADAYHALNEDVGKAARKLEQARTTSAEQALRDAEKENQALKEQNLALIQYQQCILKAQAQDTPKLQKDLREKCEKGLSLYVAGQQEEATNTWQNVLKPETPTEAP